MSDGPDGLRTVVMERSARQAEAVIRDRPEFAGGLAYRRHHTVVVRSIGSSLPSKAHFNALDKCGYIGKSPLYATSALSLHRLRARSSTRKSAHN